MPQYISQTTNFFKETFIFQVLEVGKSTIKAVASGAAFLLHRGRRAEEQVSKAVLRLGELFQENLISLMERPHNIITCWSPPLLILSY
jgi:hypothetical protein